MVILTDRWRWSVGWLHSEKLWGAAVLGELHIFMGFTSGDPIKFSEGKVEKDPSWLWQGEKGYFFKCAQCFP